MMKNKYADGKIYLIGNTKSDIAYIGSTIRHLSRRFSSHKIASVIGKSPLYLAMNELGLQHFHIKLIENFPCMNKAELEKREYEIMNTYDKAKLYNAQFGKGNITDAFRQKLRDRSAWKGKVNENAALFSRGCVMQYKNTFRFVWRDQGRYCTKTISFGRKMERPMAFLAIQGYRNNIFPLDLLKELPLRGD
jgi:hypothetical protein